jgi:hypothetical protein
MKPGLKPLIIGVALFIIGGFVIPFLMILPLFLNESEDTQFLVPGSRKVTVEKPGRYYLWNDYQTVYDGKWFGRSKSIPDGLEIVVTDDAGTTLPFNSDTSTTSRSGSSYKRTIGYVEVEDPGELMISVSGESEERVFSFSQSTLPKVLMILAGGTASLLVAFLGFGIGIWGLIKLVSKNGTANKPALDNP